MVENNIAPNENAASVNPQKPSEPSMNQVDLVVFGQSWEHYRHLENIRQQTAIFYYALIATLVTAMGFLLELGDSRDLTTITTTAIGMTSVVALYGVFAFFAVIKLQASRSAHGALIQNILARAYGSRFEEYYNTPFREQLDISTPAILRKGLVGFAFRKKAGERRELLFSQMPIFIFLPIVLMSIFVVYHVLWLDTLTPSLHKSLRYAAAAIDVACTMYVILALKHPQNSWPDAKTLSSNS